MQRVTVTPYEGGWIVERIDERETMTHIAPGEGPMIEKVLQEARHLKGEEMGTIRNYLRDAALCCLFAGMTLAPFVIAVLAGRIKW